VGSKTQLYLGLLFLFGLTGCASQEIQRKDGASSARAFKAANLAKSEVDMLAEINQRESLTSLRLIGEKLYRRNPREFRKSGHISASAACDHIFGLIPHWVDKSRPFPDWEQDFKLTFVEDYGGDRVQTFMTALISMLMASYDHKTDFFLTDTLSAQKLYNSARNLEVAVWKLSNAKGPSGDALLISNSMDGEVANLSFEREFGKLIARQDLLALIIEDRSNRSISRVFQNAAAFVFLPL
jgi:hypothetical protein